MPPLLALLGCLDVAPPPPDVMLVVLDTTRADRLGVYGGRPDVSPQLDEIAAAGVTYLDATSPATWTWPGHASLFTGEPPWTHGARFASPRDPDLQDVDPAVAASMWSVRGLRADLPTLAERFSAAGYRTVAHFSNGYLRSELGLTRGFEVAAHHPSDAETVSAAAAALSNPTDDRPLLLFVNLMSAHSPYVVAEEVPWSAAATDALDAPWAAPYRIQTGGAPGLITASRPAGGGPTLEVGYATGEVEIPPGGLQALRTIYDGELARLDQSLRRLIVSWNETGRGAGVVAVTSDHGELLGERGLLGHGRLPMPEVTAVPLVLAAPGRLPGGLTIEAPVQTHDLYGALLHLSGVGADASNPLLVAAEGRPVDAPVLAAAWPDTWWAAQIGGPFARGYRLWRDAERAILLDDAGGYVCYDRIADPGLRAPVAPERCAAALPEAVSAFPEAPPTPMIPLGALEDEMVEALRGMGYIE